MESYVQNPPIGGFSKYNGLLPTSGDQWHPPIVKLSRTHELFQFHQGFIKLESCNPTGSIKDKNAAYLINLAEKRGELPPGGTIVESSSGNFGIALAAVGAARGYRVVIVVDAKTSPTMKRMLKAYGAQLEEVPLSCSDANGSMQKARMAHAKSLAQRTPGAYYPCQHLNPDNPGAHYETGAEILAGLGHPPDAVVVGVSTCGQLAGIAKYLRLKAPATKIIAVDVVGSVVLGTPGGSYKMTGLGLSFVPPNFRKEWLDVGYTISDRLAFSMCHLMARRDGLLLGGATGAIVAAALAYLSTCCGKQRVLMLNPDGGDRYLETIYNPVWLKEQGLNLWGYSQVQDAIRGVEPVIVGHEERVVG